MVDGRRAYPSLGAYQPTARGLEGFSETLASEVALRGIRVRSSSVSACRPTRWTRLSATRPRPPGRSWAWSPRSVPAGDWRATARCEAAETGACSLRCEQYGR